MTKHIYFTWLSDGGCVIQCSIFHSLYILPPGGLNLLLIGNFTLCLQRVKRAAETRRGGWLRRRFSHCALFLSSFLSFFGPTQSARRVASGPTASGSASARTEASATSRRGGAAAAPAGRESAAGEVEPSWATRLITSRRLFMLSVTLENQQQNI